MIPLNTQSNDEKGTTSVWQPMGLDTTIGTLCVSRDTKCHNWIQSIRATLWISRQGSTGLDLGGPTSTSKDVVNYVTDLRSKLTSVQVANEEKAKVKMKVWYDKNSRIRKVIWS